MRPRRPPRLAVLALCGVRACAAASAALWRKSEQQIRCMQLQQELAARARAAAAATAREHRPHRPADRPGRPRVPGHQRRHGGRRLLRELLHLRQRSRAQPEMPRDERPRRGRAAPAHPAPAAAPGALPAAAATSGAQAELQRCARPQRLRRRRARSRAGAACSTSSAAASSEESSRIRRAPIYRSIDPNGRYRSVCVRLCDGFFYPDQLFDLWQPGRPGRRAVPVELRGAGRALCLSQSGTGDRAGHLAASGSAYMDLPVAFKFRKEYVKGCSCKQAEYNPTEIEARQQGRGRGRRPASQPPAPSRSPPRRRRPPAAARPRSRRADHARRSRLRPAAAPPAPVARGRRHLPQPAAPARCRRRAQRRPAAAAARSPRRPEPSSRPSPSARRRRSGRPQ